MIIGNLANWRRYCSLQEDFEKVFLFLESLSADAPQGKTVLRENEVWANVVAFKETGDPDTKLYEAHRRLLDFHCVLAGEEVFPEDAHIPCLRKSQGEDLVKVIAKIAIEKNTTV